MDRSRMTKADLIDAVQELEQDLAATAAALESVAENAERDVAAAKASRNPEATALDACISALDALPGVYLHATSTTRTTDTAAVVRILRHLADRFTVTDRFVTVETRDCDERHVSDLTDDDLIFMLRHGRS